jgi:hypothetical protein
VPLTGEIPDQRRLRDQPARQFGKTHRGIAVKRMDAAVAAAQHQPVAGREQGAADAGYFIADVALDGDALVDVALHQLRAAHQIELEILLEHANCRILRHRESHRGRIDQASHVAEAQR